MTVFIHIVLLSQTHLIVTMRAKLSGAVYRYCNRSCLFVCVFVCGSVTTITQNCVLTAIFQVDLG